MIDSKEQNDRYYFGGNREITIQRDGEKCVICGMTRDEHKERFKRDITVDHIDGRGMNSISSEKNNDMSNLQTLCSRCHASKDNRQGKLTAIQIINIRHAKGSAEHKQLAKLYGVSRPYVTMLMGHVWGDTRVEILEKGTNHD